MATLPPPLKSIEHRPIKKLDEITINQIAAGEVIENPASVVKELIENSLDAGATELKIEIKAGGRQLIRISDNARGMNHEDSLLSIERHATSKLRSVKDLNTLHSLGFRGEALPSIASISDFTLTTCTHEPNAQATIIEVQGGKLTKHANTVRTPGTTIDVRALFYNVPARKKFQRSISADVAEINKIVIAQALSHPKVRFELINQEKTTFKTPASPDDHFCTGMSLRIEKLLGQAFYHSLTKVEYLKNDYCITGFIGAPLYTRHNRTGQHLFVKQRPVFSSLISSAVSLGYGTALANHRHPVFVLNIDLPSQSIDVNVHPRKREVRFENAQTIASIVTHAVEQALSKSSSSSNPPPLSKLEPLPWEYPKVISSFSPASTSFETPVISTDKSSNLPPPPPQMIKSATNEQQLHLNYPSPAENHSQTYKIVTSLLNYILVHFSVPPIEGSSPNDLFLINQQTAHARVIFEELYTAQKNNCANSQNLLLPLSLKLNPEQCLILEQEIEPLKQMGFQIRLFARDTYLIEALPVAIPEKDAQDFFLRFLEQIKHLKETCLFQSKQEKRLAYAASRSSIQKQSILSLFEANHLLSRLLSCQTIHYCPQGKPTIARISQNDLAKFFQRSQNVSSK